MWDSMAHCKRGLVSLGLSSALDPSLALRFSNAFLALSLLRSCIPSSDYMFYTDVVKSDFLSSLLELLPAQQNLVWSSGLNGPYAVWTASRLL